MNDRLSPFTTMEKATSNAWRTARILAYREIGVRELSDHVALMLPDKRNAEAGSPAPVHQHVIAVCEMLYAEALFSMPVVSYMTGLASTANVQRHTRDELEEELRHLRQLEKMNGALKPRADMFREQVSRLLGDIFGEQQ